MIGTHQRHHDEYEFVCGVLGYNEEMNERCSTATVYGPGASGRMVRRTKRSVVYIPRGTNVRPMSLPLCQTSARARFFRLRPSHHRCIEIVSIRGRRSSCNALFRQGRHPAPTPCRHHSLVHCPGQQNHHLT